MIPGNYKGESKNCSFFFLFRLPGVGFYRIRSFEAIQIGMVSELALGGFTNVPKLH